MFASHLQTVSSGDVTGVFCSFCYLYNTPQSVLVDNGPEFQKDFLEFCNYHDISVIHTRPRHPFTNGCVERLNGILKMRMESLFLDNPSLSFQAVIEKAVRAINHSVHCSTKHTPIEIIEAQGTLDLRVSSNLEQAASLRNARLTRRRLQKQNLSWEQIIPGRKVFFTPSFKRLGKQYLEGPAVVLLVGISEVVVSTDSVHSLPFTQIFT